MFKRLTSVSVKSSRCDFGRATFVIKAVPSRMHQGNRNATSFELFQSRKTTPAVGRRELRNALPIVTPNGFTVVEGARLGGTTDHRFQVKNATGAQQNVSVRFDRSLMARVDEVRKSHLWIGSGFWSFRAEAHLEAYLIEKADYPPNGQLLIDDFSDDEMLLAAHWQD